VGWDCSTIDRRNGPDLAAIPQQTCGASGCDSYPYTTSYLHCGGTGGAANFHSCPASGNPGACDAHGHARCTQCDPCPADFHTADVGTAHDAGRYAATARASSQTPADELSGVWDASLSVVAS
jgi:hypothetical protein